MSIKSKVFAATATLTLVGGVGAMAATSASAATPSCGGSCINIFSRDFGTHQQPELRARHAASGREGRPADHPVPRPSNSDPAEDFTISLQGLVSDFFAADLVSAAVNLHYGGGATLIPAHGTTAAVLYPDFEAYEIQYSPYGVDSGLCVGVGSTAVAGTKVTLEPCGVSSKTVWIVDSPTRPASSAATFR